MTSHFFRTCLETQNRPNYWYARWFFGWCSLRQGNWRLNSGLKSATIVTDPFMFDAAITPEKWSLGIIHPIYKNKGDPQDPNSYRGITLVSCLGKVYMAIINEMLNSFANSKELITKSQAGFWKGYATVDNIFCLYSLIQLYFLSDR